MYEGSTATNGTASPARVSGGCAECGQMSKKASIDKNGGCKGRQRPGQVIACSQEPRERSLSSSMTPSSHQRRWSADFTKCWTPPVITVKKNKKEPQPPQRGVSLLRPHTTSHSSFKRYSCPPMGIMNSPSQSSSSSSSASSSCSSPPPVQTAVITGHDPLGWKVHPKSSYTSPRARTNRLSLQIPLPVIFPDPKSRSVPSSTSDNPQQSPDPSPKTKPPLRPKPSRRHSDSSAFLRSLSTPLPVVTLGDLCAVHLRQVTRSDESDDVFSEEDEEEVKVSAQPRKIPPPVPEKSSMVRQIAQLIARSRQRCTPVTTTAEEVHLYACVMEPKPKHSHQTLNHSSLHATKTAGLRLDTSCDRERSSPRFPGREI